MLSSRSLKSLFLGLALVVPAFLGGCDRQTGADSQPPADTEAAGKSASAELTGTIDRAQAGAPMPDLTLSDESGATLALRSLRGTPVLVNLWATWCAPCVVELPMLDTVAGEMGDKLRVLTVSQDMTETQKVAPFLAERGGSRLEPWLDPKSDLTFALGAQTLPTTILYDAQGLEIWRYVGGADWTSAQSARLIAEAFAAR